MAVTPAAGAVFKLKKEYGSYSAAYKKLNINKQYVPITAPFSEWLVYGYIKQRESWYSTPDEAFEITHEVKKKCLLFYDIPQDKWSADKKGKDMNVAGPNDDLVRYCGVKGFQTIYGQRIVESPQTYFWKIKMKNLNMSSYSLFLGIAPFDSDWTDTSPNHKEGTFGYYFSSLGSTDGTVNAFENGQYKRDDSEYSRRLSKNSNVEIALDLRVGIMTYVVNGVKRPTNNIVVSTDRKYQFVASMYGNAEFEIFNENQWRIN